MAKFGIVVTKSVEMDRDGARSLLRAYSDWVNSQVLPKSDLIVQDDVEAFLKRYANIPEGTSGG
jgi:hypothetical protein